MPNCRRSAFPEAVRGKKMAAVEAELAEMAAIQDLDRARCFMKCLCLLSAELLLAIVDLTGENMGRCAHFRDAYTVLLPQRMCARCDVYIMPGKANMVDHITMVLHVPYA